MAKIRKIESFVPRLTERKKVAAYARVSTDLGQQLNSLSAQVSYYSSYIQRNPEWEYVGVYADEGITGTSTKHRDEFNRLMEDCDAGKIDIVLVKSISRFARDTVDTLNATRHLKDIGVDVYFEKENIHSISDEGELLLTLLASFAQEESRSISENVKWGIRKKFKEGIPNGHKAPYGYEWDGEMFRIIPEQGEIVKEIYTRYLAGEPAYTIAKDLERRGVVGQSGVPMDDSTIKNILFSFSYTGTMILQKNYFTENHVRKENKGELPRYAVADMFEPLVTEEDFIKVQEIKEQRAETMPNRNPKLTAFSGMMRCGICGCSISRRSSKYGKKWTCNTKERKGKEMCDSRPIYETELMDMTVQALGLDAFDENIVKTKVERITVNSDAITFDLINGKQKRIIRKYKKGYSGFSGKVKCGNCGETLVSDTWNIGPVGQKVKQKVWICNGCKAPRVMDFDLRKAASEVLGRDNCEALFAEHIKYAINYEHCIKFVDKKGKVTEWQKE